jgi:hypothetical protein
MSSTAAEPNPSAAVQAGRAADSAEAVLERAGYKPELRRFLITLAYAVKRRTLDSLPGAFSLGRWAWPVIGFVLVYTVVVMLVLSLPAPFHGSDKVLGYGLALAALWYFGGLLWRLKKGTAGVKPVEDLVQGPPQAG